MEDTFQLVLWLRNTVLPAEPSDQHFVSCLSDVAWSYGSAGDTGFSPRTAK